MFNYLSRVADATGIDFDYHTQLPAFEPDRDQASAPRPVAPHPGAERPEAAGRRAPGHEGLRAAWASWREYLLESAEPLARADRLLLAHVAAEQSGDWATAEALGSPAEDASHPLAGFARKLSREPWQMRAEDLDKLRASGYSETAVLHAISLVAHQNADSRLSAGLAAIDA